MFPAAELIQFTEKSIMKRVNFATYLAVKDKKRMRKLREVRPFLCFEWVRQVQVVEVVVGIGAAGAE